MRQEWKAFVLLGCVAFASPVPAVQLIVDDQGELRGADGVLVNSTAYNVRFEDGTYYEIFGRVYDPTVFPTYLNAGAFADALLEQVLIDVVNGPFDSRPELTNGCELPSTNCGILIVNDLDVFPGPPPDIVNLQVVALVNFEAESDRTDFVFSGPWEPDWDTSNTVWAVWEITPAQAPEPGTLALLGLGLAGLGVSRRRKA